MCNLMDFEPETYEKDAYPIKDRRLIKWNDPRLQDEGRRIVNYLAVAVPIGLSPSSKKRAPHR